MKQRNWCRHLQAYFDGQLPAEEVDRFCEHLGECAHCQRELKHLNTISDYLKLTQEGTPDRAFFDAAWARVEKRIVRDRLSMVHWIHTWQEIFLEQVQRFMKPLVAVAVIIIIVAVPLVRRAGEREIYAQDAEIRKIETYSRNVLLCRTKNRQWCVIWLLPMAKQEGEDNAQPTYHYGDPTVAIPL